MMPTDRRLALNADQVSQYQLYRGLVRATSIDPRRPDPPRDVKFSNGFVQWEAPRRGVPITHYGIRVDHDGGDPDIVVPFPCRFTAVPQGKQAWVSSYNNQNKMESQRVAVGLTGAGGVTSLAIALPAGTDVYVVEVASGFDGQLLALELENNADGDAVFEWGENFEEGMPVDLAGYASSLNRFLFLWWNGAWSLWAKPALGL